MKMIFVYSNKNYDRNISNTALGTADCLCLSMQFFVNSGWVIVH